MLYAIAIAVCLVILSVGIIESKQVPKMVESEDAVKNLRRINELTQQRVEMLLKDIETLTKLLKLKDRQIKYLRNKVYSQPYQGQDGKIYGLRKNS